jgi:CRP-like cAMP-binding protein
MDPKLELLARVPLFSNLSRSDLEECARLTDEIDVPAGKVLMRQGDAGREFFLIVDGTVAIDRDGRRLTSLGPGAFLGEIALVDGGPRTATATAETPVRVLVLGQREFRTLIDDFKSVRIGVLEALAQRVRRLEPDAHN